MRIPLEIPKSTAFLAYEGENGPVLAGTCFFVAMKALGLSKFYSYVVTAKHTIAAIKEKCVDQKVWLRLNFRDSVHAQLIWTDLKDWCFHPSDKSVDVAVLPLQLPSGADHFWFPGESFVPNEALEQGKVGVGDEIFFAGLFIRHPGAIKNLPIIRTGNIAAMPEEHVITKWWPPMEAYLIEARSIGGLSGSPVFVCTEDDSYYLLGLMHGQWDVPELDTEEIIRSVNMGIAIVVPAKKIMEVIAETRLANPGEQL